MESIELKWEYLTDGYCAEINGYKYVIITDDEINYDAPTMPDITLYVNDAGKIKVLAQKTLSRKFSDTLKTIKQYQELAEEEERRRRRKRIILNFTQID